MSQLPRRRSRARVGASEATVSQQSLAHLTLRCRRRVTRRRADAYQLAHARPSDPFASERNEEPARAHHREDTSGAAMSTKKDGTTIGDGHGRRGYRVAIEERADHSIRIRYFFAGQKVRDPLLGLRTQDDDGKPRPADIEKAEAFALTASQALRRGERPPQFDPEPKGDVRPESSLKVALRRFLTVPNYRFPRKRKDHSDLLTMARDLIRALGKGYDLRNLTETTATDLIEYFVTAYAGGAMRTRRSGRPAAKPAKPATEAKAADGSALPRSTKEPWEQNPVGRERIRAGGPVKTEKTIRFLYQVAKFAKGLRMIPTVPSPAENWTRTLKIRWAAVTKNEVEGEQPRYEDDELKRFGRNVWRADPVVKLILHIGCGSRLGQFLFVWRSDLDLNRRDVGCGQLCLPGDGNKDGTLFDFSRRTRRQVDEYLRKCVPALERAYLAKTLVNYPLFVSQEYYGSRVAIPARGTLAPIVESTLGDLYRAFEKRVWVL
jgi:hypothetical protein